MPRPRRLMNQINIVPYVDVMLVLLVIFMVSAPFITPGVVNLPSIGKSTQAPESPIEIDIRSDGSLTVREKSGGSRVSTMEERRYSPAEFARFVRDRLAGSNRPVVIAADKDVRYENVMKTMDELQRASVKRVGLLVKQEGSR
jgi:biopolymer transport protein TolR